MDATGQRLARKFVASICAIIISGAAVGVDRGTQKATEKEILAQAASGNLRDVFLVDLFGGFVALPRTFTLHYFGEPRSRVTFSVGVNPDATLSFGTVFVGDVIPQAGGERLDPVSRSLLPTGSKKTKQFGPLVLEYYEAGIFNNHESAFLTDGNDYMWFIGGAVPLASDVAEVFISPAGPNKILHEPASGSARFCYDAVMETSFLYTSHGQEGLVLEPASDAAVISFQKLGFKPGDLFPYQGPSAASASTEENLELRFRVAGTADVHVPIVRQRKSMEVVIPARTIWQLLPDCAAPPKTK